MTPILGFLVVITAALVIAIYVFPRLNRRNPIISGMFISGVPYLLLGVLLGPSIFDFLNRDILLKLEPLLSLALGWVGLLFGINLRWRNIRRFPLNYLLFTFTQSMVSFVVILGFCGVALWQFSGNASSGLILETALILAALGCNTTPVVIARTALLHKARGKLTHLAQFVSSLDGFWGIVVIGFTMAFFNPLSSDWITAGWQWLLLSVVLGGIMGLVYLFLSQAKFDNEELTLLVFALVIFASGVGFYLRLSPIFLTMIIGVVVAQFRREAERTLRILGHAETPIYLMLLIFAGARWDFSALQGVLIAVFLGARFLGKTLGGWISCATIDCGFPVPRGIAHILQSFGGISLAIALNFSLFHEGPLSNLVLSAAIFGIVVFDEYAAWSTPRVLRQQGETP